MDFNHFLSMVFFRTIYLSLLQIIVWHISCTRQNTNTLQHSLYINMMLSASKNMLQGICLKLSLKLIIYLSIAWFSQKYAKMDLQVMKVVYWNEKLFRQSVQIVGTQPPVSIQKSKCWANLLQKSRLCIQLLLKKS